MKETITIKGAREHNLQNVDLDVPKNKLVVFTGVSGSGKSSLAFDTIYAEGQRRYVESLSSYARQFLGVMGKPDVDFIEGLSPSISIDQKSVGRNPRSTVGTITEIYDYMRLLFARVGHPFCPNDGTEISKLSVDEIAKRIVDVFKKETTKNKLTPLKFRILSPIITDRKGEFEGLFENLRKKGYDLMIIDGAETNLNQNVKLAKNIKHTIDAVVDNISVDYTSFKKDEFEKNIVTRVAESVERSTKLSDGKVILVDTEGVRHLFSESFACPKCDFALPEIEPRMFSFNSPQGACETCKGLGYITRISEDLVLDRKKSIIEGGVKPWGKYIMADTWKSRVIHAFLDDAEINLYRPLENYNDATIRQLLWGNGKVYHVRGKNRFGHDTAIREEYIGVIPDLQQRIDDSNSDYSAFEAEKYMTEELCEKCEGKRLKKEILSISIKDQNIWNLSQLSIENVLKFIDNLDKELTGFEREVSSTIRREILNRLEFLNQVGLSYLTLARSANTLSGGESQRIRLASQIGSGLTGVIYVLDEPSIGLHPRDVDALITSLKNLKNLGNTLIIVEHDSETILAADYIIDFGPKAGKHGGRIVFTGKLEEMKNANTLTAEYLFGIRKIRHFAEDTNTIGGVLEITGCKLFNLKNVDVRFPLGKLISVTGVSGSGKSTLIVETLHNAIRYHIEGAYNSHSTDYKKIEGFQYLDKVYLVDQSSIGKTPRSNPATYIGVFDFIRDIFAQTNDAKMRGFKKGRFSFNVKGGRCEKCSGAGSLKIEMQFLPDVFVTCDVCAGRRYNTQTLEVEYKGKNIYDVLSMTVEEALEFFKSHPQIHNRLKTLTEVGLSYVELGQPAPTLSGGEAQRVKLAHELSKKETGRTLYILDEPTTGLHLYDIEKLLSTLYKLIEKGNTVIVIEHNLDVIKNCHYIIDMGPEGGEKGGRILYQGPLAGILNIKNSHTGKFLNKIFDES